MMTPRVAIGLAPLCGYVLLACGGQAVDSSQTRGTATGGSSNSGGSSNGGNASGGSAMGGAPVSNAGNSAGGDATNGGGTNAACAAFADAPSVGSVAIVINNQTSQTIHVGTRAPLTCGDPPLFRVADADGEDLPEPAFCRNPCSAWMQEDLVAGCPAICLFPQAVTLEPFESTAVTWEAFYTEGVSLPAECATTGESVSCDRTRRIEPGTFTFSAQAGTELDCTETLGECGECMVQGTGGCIRPAHVGGTLFMATTTVALDEAYGITGSNAPAADFAAPAAPGPTAPVELIFTDP